MNYVLDAAIRIFRQRGFHSTSIADLEKATSLTAGSIYKAFKNKQELFLACLDRYVSAREMLSRTTLLNSASGRDDLLRLLSLYAQSSSGEEGQTGCLVVGSAVEMSNYDAELAECVRTAVGRTENMLFEIIVKGQKDGSIPSDIDGAAAAKMMLCVLQGMRVIGKTSRKHMDMIAVIDLAMKAVS